MRQLLGFFAAVGFLLLMVAIALAAPPSHVCEKNPGHWSCGTTTTTSTTTTTTSTTTSSTSSTTSTSTTTTTTSPTTTTTAPTTSFDVVLSPGDNVESVVGNYPAGTTFFFSPGDYHGIKLYPKDYQEFHGDGGAVLYGSGENVAFSGDGVGVVIDGLVIDGYSPAPQGAMIWVGSATNWVIQNSEFRNSAAGAINAKDGFKVLNNYIHHNHQIGMKAHGMNVLVEGNEIAFNNYLNEFDQAWEAGGTKFVKTTNLVVRNNYVHDNIGPGLWTDIDNINTLYEDNTVVNNTGPGIFHEISYSAVIRNNHVDTAAHGFYVGGILVANSQDVEVYGNTVINADGGVSIIHQNRGSGVLGTWETRNISVHDNTFSYSTGWTGLSKQASGDTSNIVFDHNTYSVTHSHPFHWTSGALTVSEWLALGQDANSNLPTTDLLWYGTQIEDWYSTSNSGGGIQDNVMVDEYPSVCQSLPEIDGSQSSGARLNFQGFDDPTADNPTPHAGERINPTEGWYTITLMVPEYVGAQNNVFQFKQGNGSTREHLWNVGWRPVNGQLQGIIRSRLDGNTWVPNATVMAFLDWHVPVGEWFTIEVFRRVSTESDGRYEVRIDGVLLYVFDGPTAAANLEPKAAGDQSWVMSHYLGRGFHTDIWPVPPSHMFFRDATVERSSPTTTSTNGLWE